MSKVVVSFLYKRISRTLREVAYKYKGLECLPSGIAPSTGSFSLTAPRTLKRAICGGAQFDLRQHGRLLHVESSIKEDILSAPGIRSPPVDPDSEASLKNFKAEIDSVISKHLKLRFARSKTSDEGLKAFRNVTAILSLLKEFEVANEYISRRRILNEAAENADLHPVTYFVGDVLHHNLFGTVVVSGWDKKCAADEDWKQMNKINQILKHGEDQPFYSVCVKRDASTRYCSQENLSKEVKEAIDGAAWLTDKNRYQKQNEFSQLLEVYFSHFDEQEKAFILYDDLQASYPDETLVRSKRLQPGKAMDHSPK